MTEEEQHETPQEERQRQASFTREQRRAPDDHTVYVGDKPFMNP